MRNLSDSPAYVKVKAELLNRLNTQLEQDGDPRVLGYGDIFESYPRVSRMRPFMGGFSQQSRYNPKYLQEKQIIPENDIGESN